MKTSFEADPISNLDALHEAVMEYVGREKIWTLTLDMGKKLFSFN